MEERSKYQWFGSCLENDNCDILYKVPNDFLYLLVLCEGSIAFYYLFRFSLFTPMNMNYVIIRKYNKSLYQKK